MSTERKESLHQEGEKVGGRSEEIREIGVSYRDRTGRVEGQEVHRERNGDTQMYREGREHYYLYMYVKISNNSLLLFVKTTIKKLYFDFPF